MHLSSSTALLPATVEGLSTACISASATLLRTVAYGDIVPVSNLARMLAGLEAIVGLFYMTMLVVARLVTLYCSKPGQLTPAACRWKSE